MNLCADKVLFESMVISSIRNVPRSLLRMVPV